ncbi:poly(A) polymerase [Yinghuangia soli]|uniref:RNA repair domain-containing protein n=1 Tax=Yinghuangia soli TaxID=2908204 RepID=A0AA41Q019_9ACTN|nr:poly(A) polymerase [Yinghuangia soli]MCF2528276.1 RNA repair domain-containing protein [Yinghuangia soli]
MHTSEEIYHRVRWDPRFDPARFVLGVNRRNAPPKRIPLPAFVPGGDIPWHRIMFIEADGEVVWDRATGLDTVDTSKAGRVQDPRRLRAPFFTARTPFVWDAAAGWCPAPATGTTGTPAAANGTPASVRVLTWNTLWDRYDRDLIETDRRRPLLAAALEQADADVIALQEVEPALLALLAAEPWVRRGYTLGADPASREIDRTGLLFLSRLPVREAGQHMLGPYKALSAITVATPAGPLVVAATHLTSDHSQGGASRRSAELARIAEGLADVDGDAVLVGDFNDGRSGADGPAGVLGLRDAWTEVLGPGDETATFDPVANPLAAVSSLSGRASRLDRVLLRADGPGSALGLRPTAAVLLGDRPADDGLFASDHYGVQVDLAVGAAEASGTAESILNSAPTARTAVAWIPPETAWPALQEVRTAHDPQIHRWPPHVNLLFGFVPESDFTEAAALLAEVAADTAPFEAALDGVHTFGHRDDATVWLAPAADGDEAWQQLRAALVRRFPRCQGRAEGFTPHLTLGRAKDPQRVAADAQALLSARRLPRTVPVGEFVLLSRRGDEPMYPRAVFTLGTGDARWLPEPGPAYPSAAEASPRDEQERAADVVQRIAAALPEADVRIAGSRRMGGELAGADLDLVAALPGAPDPEALAARIAAALPDATALRQVAGARVPGLRLTAGGLGVDLVLVPCGTVPVAEAAARLAASDEAAALALSAVTDADAVRAAVHADPQAFARLARTVKAWARARGLDAAPFGGLPGLAWSVLAARVVRDTAGLDDEARLAEFFATWAAWDWRTPVALESAATAATVPAAPVTVLTPTAPIRNCAEQVGPGGRDLLGHELYRAWEILDSGADPAALFAAPDLHRRHAAWAVVDIRSAGPEEFRQALGRVRGRMRALLTTLAEAGVPDAHAWPHPFDRTASGASYAVGLGRTPPTADALAALSGPWAKGLPGVAVRHAGGGEVPTLRRA